MPFALSVLGVLSLATWLYLALARGQFWRLRTWDADVADPEALSPWPSVVAVVPARNEAATIRQSLASLLRQDYPGSLSVIVVDDHSEDASAQSVQDVQRELGAQSRLTLCQAPPLPAGWTGKLWALSQGVTRATTAAPAPLFYWFTDADIVHAEDTLRRLVTRAKRDNLDLVSLMVLLQANTLPERVLIPAFLFFFLKLYPPRWVASPHANTAGAAGGCILLRREALQRIGGFAAIRSEVIDDCALARTVKHHGGRVWMGLTRKSISLRDYRTSAEIRDMIARTAFTQLRYSALLLFATLVGMFVIYVAPVGLLFSPGIPPRLLGACAWTLMILLYLPTVRFYRLSPLWALLLPVSALFYSYATLLSAVRYWLGRGAQWKGRAQAQRSASV